MTQNDDGTITIKMRDLVPHKHYVRCTLGDSEHVQEIEVVALKWSEDGKRLMALLDTHNALIEEPDTELDYIVERRNLGFYAEHVANWKLPPQPEPPPTSIETVIQERDYAQRELVALRAKVVEMEAQWKVVEMEAQWKVERARAAALEQKAWAQSDAERAKVARLREVLEETLHNDCYHPENLPEGDERCQRARAALCET